MNTKFYPNKPLRDLLAALFYENKQHKRKFKQLQQLFQKQGVNHSFAFALNNTTIEQVQWLLNNVIQRADTKVYLDKIDQYPTLSSEALRTYPYTSKLQKHFAKAFARFQDKLSNNQVTSLNKEFNFHLVVVPAHEIEQLGYEQTFELYSSIIKSLDNTGNVFDILLDLPENLSDTAKRSFVDDINSSLTTAKLHYIDSQSYHLILECCYLPHNHLVVHSISSSSLIYAQHFNQRVVSYLWLIHNNSKLVEEINKTNYNLAESLRLVFRRQHLRSNKTQYEHQQDLYSLIQYDASYKNLDIVEEQELNAQLVAFALHLEEKGDNRWLNYCYQLAAKHDIELSHLFSKDVVNWGYLDPVEMVDLNQQIKKAIAEIKQEYLNPSDNWNKASLIIPSVLLKSKNNSSKEGAEQSVEKGIEQVSKQDTKQTSEQTVEKKTELDAEQAESQQSTTDNTSSQANLTINSPQKSEDSTLKESSQVSSQDSVQGSLKESAQVSSQDSSHNSSTRPSQETQLDGLLTKLAKLLTKKSLALKIEAFLDELESYFTNEWQSLIIENKQDIFANLKQELVVHNVANEPLNLVVNAPGVTATEIMAIEELKKVEVESKAQVESQIKQEDDTSQNAPSQDVNKQALAKSLQSNSHLLHQELEEIKLLNKVAKLTNLSLEALQELLTMPEQLIQVTKQNNLKGMYFLSNITVIKELIANLTSAEQEEISNLRSQILYDVALDPDYWYVENQDFFDAPLEYFAKLAQVSYLMDKYNSLLSGKFKWVSFNPETMTHFGKLRQYILNFQKRYTPQYNLYFSEDEQASKLCLQVAHFREHSIKNLLLCTTDVENFNGASFDGGYKVNINPYVAKLKDISESFNLGKFLVASLDWQQYVMQQCGYNKFNIYTSHLDSLLNFALMFNESFNSINLLVDNYPRKNYELFGYQTTDDLLRQCKKYYPLLAASHHPAFISKWLSDIYYCDQASLVRKIPTSGNRYFIKF